MGVLGFGAGDLCHVRMLRSCNTRSNRLEFAKGGKGYLVAGNHGDIVLEEVQRGMSCQGSNGAVVLGKLTGDMVFG